MSKQPLLSTNGGTASYDTNSHNDDCVPTIIAVPLAAGNMTPPPLARGTVLSHLNEDHITDNHSGSSGDSPPDASPGNSPEPDYSKGLSSIMIKPSPPPLLQRSPSDDTTSSMGSPDGLKPADLMTPLSPTTEHRKMRMAFFTMFPIFMGYAALVTLQGKIKHRLGIGDNSSHASYAFSFATSLLYLGNLIFRLMHNVFFAKFRPRQRVYIAYCCMIMSTATLVIAYYILESKSIVWTYVAYLMGGVAIGTFESNLISCITPLGHATKVWAQLGIPIGFNGISVGAFILFATYPGNLKLEMGVYLFIVAANFCGLLFYIFAIPNIQFEATNQTLRGFFSDLRHFKDWAKQITPYALALAVDMCAVGLFSALQLYIFDITDIPIWPGSKITIQQNTFRAIFNSCSLVGDATGRKLAYRIGGGNHVHPFWFLICTVIGGTCIMLKIGILAPLGMLFIMFANGSIYAHTTKYVDNIVARRYNLIALSFWLFIGDVGSFTGANVVNLLRVLVGPVAGPPVA